MTDIVQTHNDTSIKVENLTKVYKLYSNPLDRMKEAISLAGKKYHKDFYALRNVNFEIKKGENVSIIGKNGSGKSTLLKIISGVLSPTKGNVVVNGKVSALLELGAGFNPDLTGVENLYFNGTLMGYTRGQMDMMIDNMLAFADIGDFAYQPVKTYSSGMFVRLAFSLQSNINPDILIVDEALSVGDVFFQKKCYRKIGELIDKGVTLLFVSHSEETIRTLTSRAIFLNQGQVEAIGPPAETIIQYRKLLHKDETAYLASQAPKSYSCNPGQQPRLTTEGQPEVVEGPSFGNHEAEVVSVSVADEEGKPCSVLYPGDIFTITIMCRANMDLTHLNVAFRIRNKEGIKVTSWGTLNDDIRKWNDSARKGFWDASVTRGDVFSVSFTGRCTLGPNLYEVQATITEEGDRYYTAQHVLHWLDEAAFFKVLHRPKEYVFGGICDLQLDCAVNLEA